MKASEFEEDVLLDAFERRFTEMMAHLDEYTSQIKYLHLFASLVVAVFAAIRTTGVGSLATPETRAVGVLGLLLAAFIALHIIAHLMQALMMVYVNGIRMRGLEEMVNSKLGSTVLRWESEIIPRLRAPNVWVTKGLFIPAYAVGVWSIASMVVLFLSLGAVWAATVGGWSTWAYWGFLAMAGVFQVTQWIRLHTRGVAALEDIVLRRSGPPSQRAGGSHG